MKEVGRIIRWKERVLYIFMMVRLHIQVIGKTINFMDLEYYITEINVKSKINLIIQILID